VSPENDSVDLILRHISQRFPDDLARGLLGYEGPLSASPLETQVAARHRELDRTLDVCIEAERRLKDLRLHSPSSTFEELGVAMAVLAEADSRGRGLRSVVRTCLPKGLVMQSWIYTEGMEAGIEKGIAKGIRPLVERKLGRPLLEPESAGLLARIRTEGPERIGASILDLSPQDLAAWLAER